MIWSQYQLRKIFIADNPHFSVVNIWNVLERLAIGYGISKMIFEY
jgi:hypothetical protein